MHKSNTSAEKKKHKGSIKREKNNIRFFNKKGELLKEYVIKNEVKIITPDKQTVEKIKLLNDKNKIRIKRSIQEFPLISDNENCVVVTRRESERIDIEDNKTEAAETTPLKSESEIIFYDQSGSIKWTKKMTKGGDVRKISRSGEKILALEEGEKRNSNIVIYDDNGVEKFRYESKSSEFGVGGEQIGNSKIDKNILVATDYEHNGPKSKHIYLFIDIDNGEFAQYVVEYQDFKDFRDNRRSFKVDDSGEILVQIKGQPVDKIKMESLEKQR